jgi:hypothetical protein
MKSPSEPAFTIVDRRGQNHNPEPEPEKVVALEEGGKRKKQTWEEVVYQLVIAQAGQGVLLMVGRATGSRSDKKGPFVADYLLFPVVTDNTFDWRPHAKKRLDTFLNCDCTIAHGACAVHKLYLPQWMQQDQERYQRMASQPVPKTLEMLHQAEMAKRQTNIMVPR